MFCDSSSLDYNPANGQQVLQSISHGLSQQSIPSLQPQWARVGKSLQVTTSWSLDQKLVIASQQRQAGENICDFSFSAKIKLSSVAREEFPLLEEARGGLRNRESKVAHTKD